MSVLIISTVGGPVASLYGRAWIIFHILMPQITVTIAANNNIQDLQRLFITRPRFHPPVSICKFFAHIGGCACANKGHELAIMAKRMAEKLLCYRGNNHQPYGYKKGQPRERHDFISLIFIAGTRHIKQRLFYPTDNRMNLNIYLSPHFNHPFWCQSQPAL